MTRVLVVATLTVTEDRRRNGLASDLEVLRARTEVEATAAEIPPLQQASRQYIHLISTLLGLEPTALSALLERPAIAEVGRVDLSCGKRGDGRPCDEGLRFPQPGSRRDDVNARPVFAGDGKAAGIGEFSAEVQPADEAEHIAELRARARPKFTGEWKFRARRQHLSGARAVAVGWR